MFNQLVVDLIINILQNWINARDLCKLDHACCNKKHTKLLQYIYQTDSFVIANYNHVSSTMNNITQWLSCKGIKFNTLFNELSEQYTKSKIINIVIKNNRLGNSHISEIFKQHNDIENVSIDCYQSSPCNNKTIKITRKYKSLKKLSLNCRYNNYISDDGLIPIFENCQSIIYFKLNCNGTQITDKSIVSLASNCKLLKKLILYCGDNSNITDSGIQELAKCPCLIYLEINCEYNPDITEDSISILTKRKSLTVFVNE